MKHEKSCGAVVYRICGGEPLFLVEHMRLGHTSIPKGHVEGGETEEETAAREIREETNLEVRLDTAFRHTVYYSPSDGVEKQVVFFAAEALTQEMKNQEEEVSALEWLPYDRAIAAMTHGTDREVLAHAADYLAAKGPVHVSRDRLQVPDGYAGLWFREHAADIHSHVLPGCDDGSGSMEESLRMLRAAAGEGVRDVIATSHYGIENGYAPRSGKVKETFLRLKERIREEEGLAGLRLYPGEEVYCAEDAADRVRNGAALPLNGTDYVLVEFLEYGETHETGGEILDRLKKLKAGGYFPILAHPERYQAVQQDRDLAKRVIDLGVMLQVNAFDLFLNKNEATRGLAQWMARERMISFIGSDMHGMLPKRPPRMREGIRWLYENADREYADAVVRLNAEKYLGVEKRSMAE